MTEIRPRLPLTAGQGISRRRRAYSELVGTMPLPPAVERASGRSWARLYHTLILTTDTVIVSGAILLAFFARFGFVDINTSVGGFASEYLYLSVLIALTWHLALAANHSRDTRVLGVGASEYKRVINASAITFGLLAIVFLVTKVDIARGYFVLAFPLGTVGLLGSRWLWRKWLTRQRRFNHFLSRAVVAGRIEDVRYVVGQIRKKSGAAYSVVGVVVEGTEIANITVDQLDVPVVGRSLSGVADAAARVDADTVIVAGQPRSGGDFVRNLAWQLEGTSAELVLASHLTDVAGPRIHFRPVEGLPLIQVEIPQFEGGKHVLKRALDIVVSGIALIVLFPALLALGLLVRADSAGGALFRQERVGRNGSTFRMLKFRSMVQTAEADLASLLAQNEGAGVLFKMKEDPRVTHIGRILRKYSLDELPQLWNVFVGHMSLVGPRPPLRREVDEYESHVHRRLYIKPGLTGMWQVNGRSNLSWDESVRLDLYYVENWSLAGDLVILWRTIYVLLHPTGAY